MIRRSITAVVGMFLILVLWSAVALTQASATLQQAIAAGMVDARFYGTGSSSGDSVMVDVSPGPNAKAAPHTVTVPPGSHLASSDASAQGMTILGVAGRSLGGGRFVPESTITVPVTGTATYILTAFCAEFHKNNPSETTRFRLLEPNPTMACISTQSTKGQLSVDATQAAVWMYTDKATFEEVNRTYTVSRADWDRARAAAAACNVTPR